MEWYIRWYDSHPRLIFIASGLGAFCATMNGLQGSHWWFAVAILLALDAGAAFRQVKHNEDTNSN
jgi:hypothetical protein